MASTLGRVAVVLVLTTSANTQFFDFFQGFQPAPIRPAFGSAIQRPDKTHRQTTKQEETTTSYENDRYNNPFPQFNSDQDGKKKKNSSNNTTVKPKKKTTQRLANVRRTQNFQDNKEYDGKINSIGDFYTQKPNYENNNGNYYTQKPSANNNGNYYTQKPNNNGNYYTQKPSANNNGNYYTQKPNNNDNYYTQKPNNGNYYTENPFNKGVRPVVTNGPPITNRPVTRPNKAYGVNPRPRDEDSISFPEDDTSPEVIMGPDEDYMSDVEKRRYIELAERKCDEYKARLTKSVQAIPLVPSPEPVQIDVLKCTPTTVPLVVGGKVVDIQEYPHMALLGWRKTQAAGYSWKCGGSLVSEQFILTAAHCSFQDRDNTVANGPPNAIQLGSSYLDDPGALVVKVAAVIRHPKYKQPRSYYDLALVKLVNAVKFSEVIKPACLGTAPAVGKALIATGWGRTEYGGDQSQELRSVSLPVWEMSRCQEILGTSRKLPQGPSTESQICAGDERGGKDTCQGDSGGPVSVQEGCIWRVVGVTSLGRSCGAAETPGLYAKVQRAFIASQIFGSQNIKNDTSNNQNYGSNNANSGDNNGNSGNNANYGNNNDNSYDNSNSWNNNANHGNNNRQESVYTERPSVNYNRRPQSQDSNTPRPYNNVNYGSGSQDYNNREQDSNIGRPYNQQDNSYNSQVTNNRPTRYTTTQSPIRSDSSAFDYNNEYNNQHSQNYYTTRKPDRSNSDANINYNSQNYESNNRDQSYYNRNNNYGYNIQPTQRTQNNYGDNRQSNLESYTVRPWWLT